MATFEKSKKTGRGAVFAAVYQIVEQIPPGRVTTYGRIAQMIGYFGGARTVGWAMSAAPQGLPCHRVVNVQGRTVCGWPGQREKLEQEGVSFKSNGCVDLSKHLW